MRKRLQSLEDRCESDLYFGGAQLPERPERPIGDYDSQIVQLALRDILPDASFARLAHSDAAGHQQLLEHVVEACAGCCNERCAGTGSRDC